MQKCREFRHSVIIKSLIKTTLDQTVYAAFLFKLPGVYLETSNMHYEVYV